MSRIKDKKKVLFSLTNNKLHTELSFVNYLKFHPFKEQWLKERGWLPHQKHCVSEITETITKLIKRTIQNQWKGRWNMFNLVRWTVNWVKWTVTVLKLLELNSERFFNLKNVPTGVSKPQIIDDKKGIKESFKWVLVFHHSTQLQTRNHNYKQNVKGSKPKNLLENRTKLCFISNL